MSGKFAWLVAAAAVVVLGACSKPASSTEGQSTKVAATVTSTTTTAAAASPTTTDDGAETRRAASFIAQHRAEIDKSISDMKECPSVDDVQMLICSIEVQTATIQGQILAKEMRNVTEPPIGETAPLWSDTLAAADSLGDVDISMCKADAKTRNWSAGNCATDMYATGHAADALGSVLDGWRPYGG